MDDNTLLALFALGMFGLLGFLLFKGISNAKITEFVRDDQGRIIQILEK